MSAWGEPRLLEMKQCRASATFSSSRVDRAGPDRVRGWSARSKSARNQRYPENRRSRDGHSNTLLPRTRPSQAPPVANLVMRRGDKETPSHQRFCWDAGERNVEPFFSCPGAENLLLGDSPLPAPVNEAASDAACSRQRATGHRPEPLREDWLVTLARGAFRPIDPLRGGPCFHNLSPGCGGSAGETHR